MTSHFIPEVNTTSMTSSGGPTVTFMVETVSDRYIPRSGDIIQRGRMRWVRGCLETNYEYRRSIWTGLWFCSDMNSGGDRWFSMAVNLDGWELVYREEKKAECVPTTNPASKRPRSSVQSPSSSKCRRAK